MEAAVEVWTLSGRSVLVVGPDRATIGKAADNDIALTGDDTVSRLHAVLDRFPAGWTVTDLGSSNGTYLNGERIWAPHRIRHGDELRIGHARLVFRNSDDVGHTATATDDDTPLLTPRERDVLVALCRPLLDRDLFTEPAAIKEIAAELVVSEATVKQHIVNLYDKFDVPETEPHRRTRLANEAIRRGSVSLTDLRGGA